MIRSGAPGFEQEPLESIIISAPIHGVASSGEMAVPDTAGDMKFFRACRSSSYSWLVGCRGMLAELVCIAGRMRRAGNLEKQ